MGVLAPARVVELLDQRAAKLRERLSELDAIVAAAMQNGVPRVFLVEVDHERALADTDCAFTEQLARDIESERLDGVTFWNDVHRSRQEEQMAQSTTTERTTGEHG
jgi:hypothetical protein